jgi:Flp pilus assembly protein TadD
MRASKLTACALALALASAAAAAPVAAATPAARDPFAPPAARDASTVAAAPAAGEEVLAAEAAPAPRQQKKRNLFVRIVTAPFRGLAKLFRGGDKRTKVARVKVEVMPRPTPPPPADAPTQGTAQPQLDAQATPAAAQPVAQIDPAAAAAQPPATERQAAGATPAANATPPAPAAVSSAAATGPRRAAAAGGTQQQQQAPFIPLIVGVPRDPLSQGRALFEQGYLNEAIAELSIAAVSGTNLVEANNLLGLAYDRRGWHRQAREYYARALSVAPDDPRVLNNLGYSLYLDDRYDEALGRLKQAARLAPRSAHIQNNLALVYGRLRKYDDAFRHFARAGGELYARLQTGALLDFAGRDRDAIRHFEAARRLDPTSTEALRRLIALYNRTGQRDKAEAARRELDRPKTKSAASSSG